MKSLAPALLRLLLLALLGAVTSCVTIPPSDGSIDAIDPKRPCNDGYGYHDK